MADAKPSGVRTRAVELGRKMGARGVAEQLAREGFKVGKSAVAEWLRADRARRAGAAAASTAQASPPKTHRDAKPAKPTPAPAPAPKASPARGKRRPSDDEPEDEDLDEADLAGIDPEALDFNELVKVDREVTRFMREAYREREERRYAVLARLKLEVRAALEKMRPRPKVDPTLDPASLEARHQVLERLAKMLENAKQVEATRVEGKS